MKNNISTLKTAIVAGATYLRGWKTNRKIIVIESDDWGAIRMPSKAVFQKLVSTHGFKIQHNVFERFDSLATENDLTALFEVLDSVKDRNNHSAVLTANTIVTNPDFLKIEKSGYEEYHYEQFTDTLANYPNCEGSFKLWKEGMERELFVPQFHGREHVNIARWMDALKQRLSGAMIPFKYHCAAIYQKKENRDINVGVDVFDRDNLKNAQESITDGLSIFKRIIGYPSSSFIAPCYLWDHSIEQILSCHQVNFLQGKMTQMECGGKKINHYTGEKNSLGQRYLVRNCSFEPVYGDVNLERLLKYIKMSFYFRKPAIISSHRVNYIGAICESNRETNLVQLKKLLTMIVKMWPEVEFMSTKQLGDLIINSNEVS